MGKKVLLVGGGGREHALAEKLRQSRGVEDLFIAPGNADTARVGENVPIDANDIAGLLRFAVVNSIDFTVVGPDDPLALGIVDAFQDRGLRIFGPTRAAAQIEASKVFSKQLMSHEGIPTSPFTVVDRAEVAMTLVEEHFWRVARPLVIKADGLALGKGVYVCKNYAEAETAVNEIMVKRLHKMAGDRVIIEDFVSGQEVSIHAFSDGYSFELFPPAQDHKAVFDDDKGPNTGGMGTIAPVPWFTPENRQFVTQRVLEPTIRGLRNGNCPFVGLLYPGLKMSKTGAKVLEFNARFGDPETQVYMRLLKSDLLEVLEACVDGRLPEVKVEWHEGYAVCVVIAREGYPSLDCKKAVPITGIKEAEKIPGVLVFHAGTKMVDNQLVTAGGRVLGVTATGITLKEAIDKAYAGVRRIHFEGMQYRTDIGAKSLKM